MPLGNELRCQLKDQIGGAVVDLQVTDPAQLEVAAAVLTGPGDGQSQTDPVQRRARCPPRTARRHCWQRPRGLDDAGIELDDLGLRRPSLDDVFTALTGQRPDGPARSRPGQPGAARSCSRSRASSP